MGMSQHGAVGGEHSYAVTGVVNAGPYVVAVLCFRLRLIVSLYFVDGWPEERPHLPGGGGGRTIRGAVQNVSRPRHRFSPQGRVRRCAQIHY